MNNINFNLCSTKIYWIAIVICFFISSCQIKEQDVKYKIGFSQCCNDPWRTAMNLEMQRELAFHSELALDIRIADNDNDRQEDDIRDLVRSGIDLLIVSPNESKALTSILDSFYNTGLPIILVDRKTESNAYSAFVGGNNIEIGKTAAAYLQALHPSGAKVLELQLGHNITPAIERSQGFDAEFVRHSVHTIIDRLEFNRGLDVLKAEFQDDIHAHPEVNCIFAHTDLLALQASMWLKEMAMDRPVSIVGVDGLPGEGNGIDLVENEDIDASLLYPTGGSESILIGLSILNDLPLKKIINSVRLSLINLMLGLSICS